MKKILYLALIGAALTSTEARSQDGPYKIGWIASFSGIGSAWSESGTRGMELAVDAINAGDLAGRPVKFITADDGTDPKTAADVCARLVLQDKVDAIVGFEPTPSRLACNQAAVKAHIPYVAATGTAGDVCFPNMITVGVISNQMVGPLVGYFAKNGAKRFYLIGSDYSTPRGTMKLAQSVIAASGGEVVGQSFAPMGTPDFSAEFAKIAEAKPDAILVNIVGTDDLTFHKQFGSDPRVSSIRRGDLLLFESVAHVLGPAGKGIVAVGNYFASIKNPKNDAFRMAFAKRFGIEFNPDANTVNAYNGMMLLAPALKQGNGTGAAVVAALESGKVNGPNGPLTVVHHYAAQAVYIGEAVGDGSIATMDGTSPIQPTVKCR
jgi:urea transport system substrate-binding protein